MHNWYRAVIILILTNYCIRNLKKTMKITQHQQKRVKNPNPHLYKTKLTSNDKTELKAIFENLDPKIFWYLKSTIPEQNQKAKSVEERMIDFALSCNNYQ